MKRYSLSLHQLNEQNIPQLIRLSKLVGWDYDESEIKTIMAAGAVYGHSTSTGDIASSAAIIPYGSDLASLGMVIVHPNYRWLGLGKEVTMHCIESVESVAGSIPMMLIATPEGKPMYEGLGFKSVDCVHKFLCDSYRSPTGTDISGYGFIPFHSSYLPEVIKLDHSACGAKRERFLTVRIEQATEAILVKNSYGDIVGYALSIQGTANLLIGPIVAPNYRVALGLLDRLVPVNKGRLRIDIPCGQPEFEFLLTQCGFEMVTEPPIMLLNSDGLPKRNGNLFGISAQVFG